MAGLEPADLGAALPGGAAQQRAQAGGGKAAAAGGAAAAGEMDDGDARSFSSYSSFSSAVRGNGGYGGGRGIRVGHHGHGGGGSSGTKVHVHKSGSVDISINDDQDEDDIEEEGPLRVGSGASCASSGSDGGYSAEAPRSSPFHGRQRTQRASSSRSHSRSLRSPSPYQDQQQLYQQQVRSKAFGSSSSAASFASRGHGHGHGPRMVGGQSPSRSSYLAARLGSSSLGSSANAPPAPGLGMMAPQSAAVLGAMNALQDKIAGLERELAREQDECLRLRGEVDRIRKRDKDSLAQLKQARETVVRLETELASERREHAHLQDRADAELSRAAEQAKSWQGKHEELLGAQHRAEQAAAAASAKREEAAAAAATTQAAVEEQVRALQRRVADLETELEREAQERRREEATRAEAEEVMQGLVELNQGLVAKVAEQAASMKKPKGKKKGGSAASTPRGGGHGHSGAPRLRTQKRAAAKERKRRESVDKQLVRANLGKPVPFLLGSTVGPTFSVYAQAQGGLADDQAYGALEPRPSAPASGGGHHHHQYQREEDDQQEQQEQGQGHWQATEHGEDAQGAEPQLQFHHQHGPPDEEPLKDGAGSSAAASVASGKEFTFDWKKIRGSDNEISAVMASLKRELAAMQQKYQQRLSAVSVDEASHGQGFSTDLSRELTALVDKIEAKGQQLYSLERYRSVMNEARGRSPVASPTAYNRKVRTLRALQAFRQDTSAGAD